MSYFYCFAFFESTFKDRRDLALENLALRQQLAVLKRTKKRLPIESKDRLFWVWLSRIWTGWRESLIIFKPETVIKWHKQGFRLFWTRLSRRKTGGPTCRRFGGESIDRTNGTSQPIVGRTADPRRTTQARNGSF